jgi:membrane protein
MLAIPPLLIVMLSIIPFIPIENFQESLMAYIGKAMPESAFELVESTLNNLVSKKQQTLISLSFILALIYSSNSFQAILDGFSYSYNIEKPHSLVVQYLRSFALMFMVSVMVIIGMALITFTGPVVDYLVALEIISGSLIHVAIGIVKWLLIIMVFEIGISVLYRAGHSGKWKAFNAGASFATLGLIIVSSLFAYYVNNFGNYNKLYGSVGTLLVVMLWIYFNTIVLLIGFEINTAIEKAKGHAVSELEPDEVLA